MVTAKMAENYTSVFKINNMTQNNNCIPNVYPAYGVLLPPVRFTHVYVYTTLHIMSELPLIASLPLIHCVCVHVGHSCCTMATCKVTFI